MGKSSFLIVMGLVITVGIFGAVMNRNSTQAIDNSTAYFSRESARNANLSAMQLALRRLADSTTWRTGFNNIRISESDVSLKVTDSTYLTSKWMKLVSKSTYYSDSIRTKMDTMTTSVLVQSGFVPWSIRGAFTAFGPLDWTMSDMVIDGRDHDTTVLSAIPPLAWTPVATEKGVYGISTSAPVFVNSQNAKIGGTSKVTDPPVDYAPSFPNNPAVVETSSPWPNGFPTTPDAAIGWPEGSLKAIAKSGINGSRYITRKSQYDSIITLNAALHGVTYFDVPANDTLWLNKKIPTGSDGIIAFHCDTKLAYWKWILSTDANQTFTGLMILDRVHHIHINILGAIIELTSNTVQEGCMGNQDKTISYSSKVIEKYIGAAAPRVKGGWRSKLKVVSWLE